MTSHMTMPKLHTSLADVNFLYAIASGAVQRMGILPPCLGEINFKLGTEEQKKKEFKNLKTNNGKPLLKQTGSPLTTYTCGVRPLGIVLQHPGQAKVGHFTLQGVVDEDVTGC